MAPVEFRRVETLEDPNVTTADDRARIYGQEDHRRLYGRDFANRVASAGFTVSAERHLERIDPALIDRCRLRREDGFGEEPIFVCTASS
jgi:hypothetical protein